MALVVEDVYAQHQTVLRGILRFSKAHGPWAINIIRGRKGDADLAKLRKWGCDGIVASRIDAALARFAHRRGIPALQISVVDPPDSQTSPLSATWDGPAGRRRAKRPSGPP